MGILQTRMGSIANGGISAIVKKLHGDLWSGALRLRDGRQFGNIWMVGGEIVHAALKNGTKTMEGGAALERLASWQEGTYLLDDHALPPERSIREETGELLRGVFISATHVNEETAVRERAASRMDLETLLSDLRVRVPGIESLSVSSGEALAATTEHDTKTREWLHRQWRVFREETGDQTETLLLRQGERILLVAKCGSMATILSAHPNTTPEALLWAGAEAGRKIKALQCSKIPVNDA